MPDYKHARPRGFAPWNPSTASIEIIESVRQILEWEAEYLPLTARQLFYRMVAHFRYPKTENAYGSLCNKLNRARRAGLLPWSAIRDDGETAYTLGAHTGHFASVRGLDRHIRRNVGRFQLNPQIVQPCVVEVHVEAAGMLPQVAGFVQHLGADCYSAGGFGSVTGQYETARRLAARRRPTVILSVGDFDPSGISLYWSWRENVLQFFDRGTKYLGTDPELAGLTGEGTTRLGLNYGANQEPPPIPLFRRIAVTPEQVDEYDLETAPPKRTDKRGNWSGDTVQCEALESRVLERIVREAVLEHYDYDAIDELADLSEATRAELRPLYTPDIWDIDVEAVEAAADIAMNLRDRGDWRAGYSNDDELDMQEGV